MDGSEAAKEVTFCGHGTTDLDSVHDESSEGLTVNLPPQSSTPLEEDTGKKVENLESILAFFVEEIKGLKTRLDGPERSITEDYEDESESVSTQGSKIAHLIPTDRGRWKSSKAGEQARMNFTQTLKDLDISNNDDNWILTSRCW